MPYKYFNPETKVWSSPQTHPVFNPSASIGDIIFHALKRDPQKVAQILADDGSSLTYLQILTNSVRIAINLLALGLKVGDTVSIVGRNNRDIAAVVFGSAFAGAAINCLEARLSIADLGHILRLTQPKVVICEASNRETVELALEENSILPSIFVFGDSLSDLLEPHQDEEEDFLPVIVGDAAKETAIIMCSSGTTGLSKGVCYSHAAFVSQVLESWPILASDVAISFSSLYWISGVLSLFVGTLVGATRVISEKPFDPDWQLELIERYKISHVFNPPEQLAVITKCPRLSWTDLSSVRMYITGGYYLDPDMKRTFESFLPNKTLVVGYGMTEYSVFAMNMGSSRPSSVGRLLNRVAVRILDESGNHLGPNERGLLSVRTPIPFLGYLSTDSGISCHRDPDGWFETGDLAFMDDDGFLHILGRSKENFKYLGHQISSHELEAFIQRETGITRVCVVGVSDLALSTDLPALALVHPERTWTESAIMELAEKKLSDIKRFRGGVYFFDELPVTPSGKIKKGLAKVLVEERYRQATQRPTVPTALPH